MVLIILRCVEQIHRALDLVDDVHHSLSIGDRIVDTMSSFGTSLWTLLVRGNGTVGRKREHYHGGFHRRSDDPHTEIDGHEDIRSNEGELTWEGKSVSGDDAAEDERINREITEPDVVHRPRVLAGLLSQRNSSGQYKCMENALLMSSFLFLF
jgi:hypothetical protein